MTGQGDHRMTQIKSARHSSQIRLNLKKQYRTSNGFEVRGLDSLNVEEVKDEKGKTIYHGNPIAIIRGEMHAFGKWTMSIWNGEGGSLIYPSPAFDLVEYVKPVDRSIKQTSLF